MRHILYIIFGFLVLPGCSNWVIKERCENTNWFQYSQGVAFDGRYLDEDGFIKDCRKVDRISAVQIDQGFKLGREKMCQYDEIFSRAKDGTPVFFKFCDGLDMKQMKSRYSQGLVLFCTNEKGFSFGKSGRVYKNLCSAAQESKFLPSYYKGRKEYLKDAITNYEKLIRDLHEKESSLSLSENRLSVEYSALPAASECHYKAVYNESSKETESKLICEEASYIRSQRSEISSALSTVRGNLWRLREDSDDAITTLRKFRLDLSQVP